MRKSKPGPLDRELCHRIIDELTDRHMAEFPVPDTLDEKREAAILRTFYSAVGHRNVDVLADISESFIETQFYLSLVIGFFSWYPGSLFTPTSDFAEKMECALAAEEKHKSGKSLTKQEESALVYCSFSELIRNAVTAIPQARLPELKGGRADLLLLWGDHRLVVECDGFAFHKDEAQFINDRQRDRMLIAAGYEVMRFAGKELTVNAPQCAMAVMKHIFDHWGFYEGFAGQEAEPNE